MYPEYYNSLLRNAGLGVRIRANVFNLVYLDVTGYGWVTGSYTGELYDGYTPTLPQSQPPTITLEELIQMFAPQDQGSTPDELAPQEQALQEGD